MRWKCFSLFFCTFLIFFMCSIPIYACLNAKSKIAFNYAKENNTNNTEVNNNSTTTQSSITILPSDKNQITSTPSSITTGPPIDIKTTTPGPVKITPPIKKNNTPLPNGSNKVIKYKNPLEAFINNKKLKSTNNFLIWVSTSTQKVHVFYRSKDSWLISKSFICTVGKDSTPTIKGTFKTLGKAYFVFDKKYNCYLKYVTRIYKGYLFHSVILNKNGKVIDGTLGKKKSHGCVRLSLNNSEWLYKTVPIGTTVFID